MKRFIILFFGCILFLFCLGCNKDKYEPKTYSPIEKAAGNNAEAINVCKKSILPIDRKPLIPKIIDNVEFRNTDLKLDFSKTYDYSSYRFSNCYGAFTELEGNYKSNNIQSLNANVCSKTPFPYGTYEAEVTNNGGDSGIIFGLSSSQDNFWEENGISYYFYFISFEGLAYLGKTNNGVWGELSSMKLSGFDSSSVYKLKIVYKSASMLCYVNDKYMFSYRDSSPLKGTGWGIRAGTKNALIGNINISSNFE